MSPSTRRGTVLKFAVRTSPTKEQTPFTLDIIFLLEALTMLKMDSPTIAQDILLFENTKNMYFYHLKKCLLVKEVWIL